MAFSLLNNSLLLNKSYLIILGKSDIQSPYTYTDMKKIESDQVLIIIIMAIRVHCNFSLVRVYRHPWLTTIILTDPFMFYYRSSNTYKT